MGSLNFQLTDSAEIYGRVFAVNGSVPTQLAPSAYFGGSTSTFKVNSAAAPANGEFTITWASVVGKRIACSAAPHS
jgi:hypothetical protein